MRVLSLRPFLAAACTLAFAVAVRPAVAKPVAVEAADGDRDGLSDFQELHKYRTDPSKADSDGDGKPDGDGDERREFTYSIRCVVEHLPPAEAISDDWQDARVVSRSDEAVRLEIVAYPLATPDVDIPDGREWRAAARAFAEHTKPNLTCDFDAAMTKELVAALRKDGIDPEEMGDHELVKRVTAWSLARSRTVSMGFSSFCVTAKKGRLTVEPGLEEYMATACAKVPVVDGGGAAGIEPRRTVEQQLDAELRGRSMFRTRIHGSCTSTAIYLQTLLRSLGLPTRTTVGMPPADGNDDAQRAMLRAGLRPSALRDAILEGPQRGWAEHTFNVVRVGGRWRRLNYAELGQPIVDRHYLGLMLRILDYDDIASSGVSATWGKKWALGTKSAAFPHGNPYRLVEVSDLVGPHAKVELPASVDRTTFTIKAATWTVDLPSVSAALEGQDPLELTLAESVAGESYERYTRFAKQADVRFVLRAEGHPDVPAAYAWMTVPRSDGQHLVLATRRKDLKAGVLYSLVPVNETGTHRWIVREGLAVER